MPYPDVTMVWMTVARYFRYNSFCDSQFSFLTLVSFPNIIQSKTTYSAFFRVKSFFGHFFKLFVFISFKFFVFTRSRIWHVCFNLNRKVRLDYKKLIQSVSNKKIKDRGKQWFINLNVNSCIKALCGCSQILYPISGLSKSLFGSMSLT